MMKLFLAAPAAVLLATGAAADPTGPTCSDIDFLAIDVHGQHVVRDYVAGGEAALDWPPGGGEIGEAVSSNGGAAVPGGPGPGYHFPNGVAPGASFCTDSRSPGAHL